MKDRIIEICELGQPKSIIHRENEPISELIKTTDLVEELNKQLLKRRNERQITRFAKSLGQVSDTYPKELFWRH